METQNNFEEDQYWTKEDQARATKVDMWVRTRQVQQWLLSGMPSTEIVAAGMIRWTLHKSQMYEYIKTAMEEIKEADRAELAEGKKLHVGMLRQLYSDVRKAQPPGYANTAVRILNDIAKLEGYYDTPNGNKKAEITKAELMEPRIMDLCNRIIITENGKETVVWTKDSGLPKPDLRSLANSGSSAHNTQHPTPNLSLSYRDPQYFPANSGEMVDSVEASLSHGKGQSDHIGQGEVPNSGKPHQAQSTKHTAQNFPANSGKPDTEHQPFPANSTAQHSAQSTKHRAQPEEDAIYGRLGF